MKELLLYSSTSLSFRLYFCATLFLPLNIVTYLFSVAPAECVSFTENSRPPTLNLALEQSSQAVAVSPTSYDQPATPDHPPPSPTTAVFGIQQKINPNPQVHVVYVSYVECFRISFISVTNCYNARQSLIWRQSFSSRSTGSHNLCCGGSVVIVTYHAGCLTCS